MLGYGSVVSLVGATKDVTFSGGVVSGMVGISVSERR